MPERRIRDLNLAPSANTTEEWNDVSAAVRNTSFFSARVEDERLLAALQALVDQALTEEWSVASFIDAALQILDDIWLDEKDKDEAFEDSYNILYNANRLRLIYQTQRQLSVGFRNFVDDFDPYQLQVYPAWRFYRQPGAKEQNKRPDHVKHEGFIRLKTDIKFWLDRNSPDQGGFGNPYGPWGFNSWMRTAPVDRERAEKLGLLRPGERMTIPPEYAPWNLNNVLTQIGTTSVVDLAPDARQRVIDDCEEEGIEVVLDPEDETMHVDPPSDLKPPPELDVTPPPAPENVPSDPDMDGLFDIDSEEELEEWLRRQNEKNEGLTDAQLIDLI